MAFRNAVCELVGFLLGRHLIHVGYTAQGMGAHPMRGIALSRALTEAAQSRLTYIAGSRDDVFRDMYARLRDPEVKRRILAERDPATLSFLLQIPNRVFPIGNPPQYEPAYEDSIEAIARREGRDPEELLYEDMLGQDGRELLFRDVRPPGEDPLFRVDMRV